MSDDATAVLICQYVAIPPPLPSCERRCAECGACIWVSQSMVARVDNGDVKPLCPRCVYTFMHAQPDLVFKIAPEQTDELLAAGALGAADQIVTELNQRYRTRRRS